MKKTRKRNALVLALIVLLIATAIGYAAFASSLEISGNASAIGNWDVHFASASITSGTGTVTIKDNGTASSTGDSLEVAVNLTFPGQTSTVTVGVVNASSCTAELTGFTIEAEDDGDTSDPSYTGTTISLSGSGANSTWTDGVLQMKLNKSNFDNTTPTSIASGATQTYEMEFTWVDGGETEANVETVFTITMNFAQPTP